MGVHPAAPARLLAPTPLAPPVVQSPIRRVGPTFLSDRIPVISPEQSAALVGAMQKIGMVDADGWLLGDPDTNKPVSLVSKALVCVCRPAWRGCRC